MKIARYVIVLAQPLSLMGFIYNMEVAKQENSGKNKQVVFIGLSDFHDKTHAMTLPQLEAIDQFLAHCPKDGTKIIVEDLSSAGSGGRFACGHFHINSRGGILGGIATKYKSLGMHVDNVEYRYCRVTSLSPALNNLQSSVHSFLSTSSISVEQLVQEIQSVAQEVLGYQDGAVLNAVYKKGVKNIMKELKKLSLHQDQNNKVSDYLAQQEQKKNKLNLLKQLLTFDSTLLDFKMVHSVLNSDASCIVAIAGGSHIAKVVELLQKASFKSVYRTPIEYSKEMNLQNCLGSHIIDNSYCVRPHPIELHDLKKFIPHSAIPESK